MSTHADPVTWEVVEPTLPVLRADYRFGNGGQATTVAVGFEGGLLLLSPPVGPRAEPLFEALAAWGPVTHIVAPCGFHRLGVPGAVARFPEAGLFAPAAAAKRVGRVIPGAPPPRPISELRLPPHLVLAESPHTLRPDTIGRFETPAGRIWYLNDLVLNLERLPSGWLLGTAMRLVGFQAGLAVNRFGWRFVVRVGSACQEWLAAELEAWPPDILVPGHGPVLRDSATLATLADLVRAGP